MRILIVEDDIASRMLLSKVLGKYGECDVAIDGIEALESFLAAHKEGSPFRLVCLDIMMPKLNGLRVLKAMRDYETQEGVPDCGKARIIITSALNDRNTVIEAYGLGCDAYAWKPIDPDKLDGIITNLGLIE